MIVSRRNRRLKDIRRLRRCKGDRALLEGVHLIGEACALGIELETVLASPEFLAGEEARGLLERLPGPPLEVAPELLRELGDADSPRGILAVASLPRRGPAALPRAAEGIYLFVEGLQDPGNLGAVARSAESAGAAGLALASGCVHPNHPRCLRASAGSLLRLPVAIGATLEELDRHLAPLRPRRVALVPRGGADLYRTALEGALVLALGAEGPGLGPETLKWAELQITIPVRPPVESLNAAVAAAVALFEIGRRRQSDGAARRGPP